MKYLLLVGMLTVVLTLAYPHMLEATQAQLIVDTAKLGLLGMGLWALGIARKQQNRDL